MDSTRFYSILGEVLAPDTDRIKQATSTLRKDYYPLPESLVLLLQLLFSDESLALRQLAATQARSLVPKHWASFPTNQKIHFRQQLLKQISSEDEGALRQPLARTISSIAKTDFEEGQWLDLVDLMLSAAANGSPLQKEISTYLLYTLLDTAGDNIMHKFGAIFAVFKITIQSDIAEVRINTMQALGKLAMLVDADNDEDSLGSLQQITKPMCGVLKQALDAGEDGHATQALEVFQTLIGCDTRILNKFFYEIMQFMVETSTDKSNDDDVRVQIIAFVIEAVRYRKLKIQGLRLGEPITLKCLEIVTEMEDDDFDDDDITPATSALSLLDLLASSLSPSQVVVPLLHNLGPYVTSDDPHRRKGGIMALSECIEGAPDFVSTQLQEIMKLVLHLMEDPNDEVRLAAINCVQNLSDELAEDMGKEHANVIPLITKNLETAIRNFSGSAEPNKEDRTRLSIIKSSCNALNTMVEDLEAEDVNQYLPALLPRMSLLISHDDPKIKAAAIGAVGSLAASAKGDFLPYFERTMTGLSEYVRIKDSEEELELRAAVCDSIGSIGMAVGPERFQHYLVPLMEATEEALHLDNPRLKESSYIFWSTMAKVYKTDFKPYLDGVLKSLFACLEQEETALEVGLGEEAADIVGQEVTIAGRKVKVAAASDDADDIEDLDGEGDDDDAWDDFQTVTAVALEKEIAVEVVADVMTYTRHEFMPYLEHSVGLTLPLVMHSYEGIKKAAISTLFRAYATVWSLQEEQMGKWKPGLPLQVQPTNELKQLRQVTMAATLPVWQEEEDRSVVTDINRDIAETLKLCGPALIADPSDLKTIVKILLDTITKKHPCQQDMGDDSDLDEIEESSEYDWLIVDTALDAVMGLATALGESFGELWLLFEKSVIKHASSSESVERSASVGVIAECIKCMGKAVTPYTSGLLKLLLHRLSDEDLETKSNAAYALGLLQANSNNDQEILKSFNTILAKLEPLLQTQEARAMDNAAGCVSRMILKHEDRVPIAAVLPALIGLLPLKEDFEENDPIYQMIVQLYSAGEPTIVGLTPQLIPIIAQVMASAPEKQVQDDTRTQLVHLIKFVYGKQPALIKQHSVLMDVLRQG